MATATPADADFDARLSALESRLSRVEGIVEQLDRRLTNIEATLRWIIGIQVTTLLTLGTLILVKLG
ncbi:MAG: hypothetical protein OXU79_07830 [Gemmatimonadota bacterium]|nr:hypothetical protein [Gemmatimonadota bacterium]